MKVVLGTLGAGETLLREDQRDNEAVETQSLGENENEDHAHEQLLLLAHRTHAGIAHNSNGHTSGKSTKIYVNKGSTGYLVDKHKF